MKKIKYVCILTTLLMFLFFFSSCISVNKSKFDFNYSIMEDNTAEITLYHGDAKEYIIPKEIEGHLITKIGDNAFKYSRIKTLTIPSNIISIGIDVFVGCANLTTVTFEGESELTSIGDGAFSGCSNLVNLEIPNSLMALGTWVFSGCKNLKFNEYANGYYYGNQENPYLIFHEPINPSVENFDMNENTKIISDRAFVGCRNLKKVVIPEDVIYVGKGAFEDCNNLESLTIPFVGSTQHDFPNTEFNHSFIHCLGYIFGMWGFFVEDVNSGVPESLKEVVVTGGTKIDEYAFYGCDNLTSITIPESVTRIDTKVFYGCKNLESVYYAGTIEDWWNIEKISDPMNYASHFYMLNEKNEYFEFVEIEIPEGVSTINAGQFNGFGYIKNIKLPSSLTYIGVNAFYGCKSLTNLDIPNSVTNIDHGAFSYCSNLESITIPNGVTSIGDGTFYFCEGLKSVTIPKSVASIGEFAFEYCFALENVYYTGTIEDWCNIKFVDKYSNPMSYASHFYMLDENNEFYEVTEIVIPNTIKSLSQYQFYGFENIESITIPFVGAALNGIENTHFGYIFGATTERENSKYIPTSLKEVKITGGASISYHAFLHCDTIASITISKSVTSMGDSAFYGCNKLKNVYYEGTLEEWCKIFFAELYSTPLINYGKFYLKNNDNEWIEIVDFLEIPNGMTTIDYQFRGLSKLNKLIIPESVTSIGEFAFENAETLNWVFYKGTSNDWDSVIIDLGNSNLTDASRYYYSEVKPTEEGNYWHYDIDGVTPIIW